MRDTGIGISQEDQRGLFQLFGKLKTSAGINKHGIGLGLTICKQLSEAMGGRIWLESQINQGTSFYFTLKNEGVDYESAYNFS